MRVKMKRHKCFICNQKRSEEGMIKVVHTGKNGLAYFGWVCKRGSYRNISKNRGYGVRDECEDIFAERENVKI